jgi:hypothetical protein
VEKTIPEGALNVFRGECLQILTVDLHILAEQFLFV